jgi:hypothetical protein
MINNIQPINFNSANNSKLAIRPSMAMKSDNVSFCGVADKAYTALTRTRSGKDAEELSKLLFSSYEHSFLKANPQGVKQSWFGKMYDKFYQKFHCKMEKLAVKQDEVYIDVIKDSNGKVVGGMSMFVEPEKSMSYVNYIVLAPELKRTKKGKEMLLDMADRIIENTEKHRAFEISWSVRDGGKPYERLMNKIPHYETDVPFSKYTEYSVFVDKLKDVLKNIRAK